ncbi:substrate-binding domain-containing protein [Streptomyces misionensis]|uniref:substrate-binding domain-containing protein n=1 Tax=Streptomyces misionensis TaxID=67331 RepID=UPI0033A461FF
MLSPDRHDLLLAHLREHGSARISDLVGLLGVSDVTVRRDVEALEREGLVRRFHGGVTLDRRTATADREPDRPRDGLRLGLLLPNGPYFREVLEGAREAAAELGVELTLAFSDYQPEQDLVAIRRHLDDGVDGLLLAPPPLENSRHTRFEERLRELRIPVVLVERELRSTTLVDRLDHVVTDHQAGARLAVEHLARLGHRRIALMVKDLGPTAPAVRLGYTHALRALGLDQDTPVHLVPQRETSPHTEQRIDEALDDVRAHGATAVLAHGDAEAILLLQLAAQRGIRVPQDLAIVSYDDEVAALAGVPLTAVAPPKRALGRKGIELLTSRLRSTHSLPVHHLTLQPSLAVRASCGRGGMGRGRRGR